jgi:hypothetical protein
MVAPPTTLNHGVDDQIVINVGGAQVFSWGAISFANVDQTTPIDATFACPHIIGSASAAAANAQMSMTPWSYNGWNGGGAQLFILGVKTVSCGACGTPIRTVISPYDQVLWTNTTSTASNNTTGVLRLNAPSIRGGGFPLVTVSDSVQTNDVPALRLTIRAAGVTYGS